MAWQQWFILYWMQFAVSSLFILLVANLVLRWVAQPIEKVRLIQWMLAALVAMPLLFAFPIMPFRSLNMGAWFASSTSENSPIGIGILIDRVEDTGPSSFRLESNFVRSNENAKVATAEPLHHPSLVLNRDARESPIMSNINSVASHTMEFDYWWLAAVGAVVVHAVATLYFLIQYGLGILRLRQTLQESNSATESLRSR